MLLTLGMVLGTAPASGQGCSQCRESVGQTPLRTQRAYREGISVLVVAATFICGATVLMIRRFR